ncbi:MAG: DUF429 domain-containing protein [Dehalococcoidia bacterium]|nr:DUF429 domain-containing protein [Dehalococcoidia bacterium]MCB9485520.1 DUF429 domain-containing protein [Thermoflexaceae bacterium]
MTAFAGLDLAWTTTHPSGVCVLETIGGTARLVEIASQITPVEVLAADMRDLGPDSIVAVDAPLIRRDGCMAERELGRVFGRFHASAYMASMAFLESRKPPLDAGPRLGDALSGVGFTLDPLLVLAGGGGRRAFEMYPHAFHVAAFGLDERILYKKGRRATRLAGMARYQALLGALLDDWAPEVAADARVRELLAPDALKAKGKALKAVEDQLDAISCAVAALMAGRDGICRGEVFGDPATGSIAVPGMRRDSRFIAPTASC